MILALKIDINTEYLTKTIKIKKDTLAQIKNESIRTSLKNYEKLLNETIQKNKIHEEKIEQIQNALNHVVIEAVKENVVEETLKQKLIEKVKETFSREVIEASKLTEI
jgi:hypothetical protein